MRRKCLLFIETFECESEFKGQYNISEEFMKFVKETCNLTKEDEYLLKCFCARTR